MKISEFKVCAVQVLHAGENEFAYSDIVLIRGRCLTEISLSFMVLMLLQDQLADSHILLDRVIRHQYIVAIQRE